MRKLIAAMVLVLMAPTAAGLPLDEQAVVIRWARFRYNLTDQGEAFLRTILRKENGRKGSEAGLNPHTPTSFEHHGDPQAYADITAPEGSEQQTRLTRRIVRDLQDFVFNNPKRRVDFLIYFAEGYLAGGLEAKSEKARRKENWNYFRSIQQIVKQERGYVAGRVYNPILPCEPLSVEP